MRYFKKTFLLLAAIVPLVSGCNSESDNAQLSLIVTDFQTSENAVKLVWELERPNNMIVTHLQVYREATNNLESDFPQFEQLANLPSNETTFTDSQVPFKSQISYKVRVTYYDQNDSNPAPDQLFIDAELQIYNRPIIAFTKVPLQIKQDPAQPEIYHILGNTPQTGYLKRYNSTLDQISNAKSFADGWTIVNNFHIVYNEIFVADYLGKIFRINSNTYDVNGNYSVPISDNLNAFAIDGDRIYFQDENIWFYYTISNGITTPTSIATTVDYAETLDENKFLFFYSQAGSSSAAIYGYSPQNCNAVECSPNFIQDMNGNFPPQNSIDPHIFSWNSTKQKFVSSYNGAIFNRATLQQEIRLKDVTGKRYFNFAFDAQGNIYGSVQGEKIIHKFNSSYELIASISTKLYPFFIMVNSNGIQSLGTYEPQDYYGFYYGGEFVFNVECAIERL